MSSPSSSVNLTVHPYPTAHITPGGTATFCGSGTLKAAAGTGYSYQWQLGGADISGATGSTYTVTQSGSYAVRVTANGCSSTSGAVAVTVNPAPTASLTPAGPLTISGSNSVTLSAATGSGYTYQWQLNNSPLTGATGSTYVASQAGSYSVVVTANGCSSTSNAVSVTSSCLTPPVILTADPGIGASLATRLTASTRSLALDGVDDQISIPNFNWAVGSPITIEFWIRVNEADVKPSQAFAAGSTDNIPNRMQAHVPWTDKRLYWDFGNATGNGRISTDYTAYLDKWTHVALVSAGVGGTFMGIYLDGVLVQSRAISEGLTSSLTGLAIGLFQKASMDEFRIWNKVRTQAEIQAHMNHSPAANAPNLVAYWRLDEGSGTTVADATGRGSTGTLTNGPVWSPTATSYAWNPAAGLDAATGPVVYATPSATTHYTATATFASGCTGYAVATVGGADYNYVITNAVQRTGITTDDQLASLIIDKDQLSQSIAYSDELGRPVQEVSTQGSPTKLDLVQPTVYDAAGRAVRKYLPYTGGNDGRYKSDALTAQPAFYQQLKGDNTAFAESRLEDSPLNRVVEQSAPGTPWQMTANSAYAKTQKMAYGTNAANEIRVWNFNLTTKTASGTTFYPAHSLLVTQHTDEHGAHSWEYKDKAERTVAKRSQNRNAGLIGYYPFSGNAHDAGGTAGNGIVNGATLTTDRLGNPNSAYQFNGSSSIRLPAANLALDSYTYSLWVKPASNPPSGGMYAMLSVGNATADQTLGLTHAFSGNTGWTGVGAHSGGAAASVATSGTLPAANTWYHLTLTRDRAHLKLYVNGALVATVSTNGANPGYGASGGAVAAVIGVRSNLSQYFQGAIDEVRIYNRALAGAEVNELYTQASTNDLMTYYVYDDIGNLRLMLPPEAVNNLASVNYSVTYNDAFCRKWVFASDYDDRFRVVENLKPGAGPSWLIYDPADRLVLEQDAAHRPLNQWMFTKYDALGRSIMSGRYTHAATSRAAMQTVVDHYYETDPTRTYYETRSSADFTNLHGYSNQAFPPMPQPNGAGGQPYIVNYFDDYDFDANGTAAETAKGEPAFVLMPGYTTSPAPTKGKATGERVLVLGTGTWLTSAVYYDPQGRVIQTQDENYNNAAIVSNKGRNLEVSATLYEGLTNRAKQTENWHCYALSDNTPVLTIKQAFSYDAASRPTATTMTVGNGSPETLATYAYNEAGEMIRKTLGTGQLQTVDYRYNIRGWMKSINEGTLSGNDLFAMRFRHEETDVPQPQYNGNLSRYDWISKTDNVLRTYQLGYDGSNRFSSADYSSTATAERFSVSTTYHDDNGNIKTLHRQNLVARNGNAADTYDYVDKLAYAYEGNQLQSVEDDPSLPANAPATDFKEQSRTNVNPTEYSYDPSGKLLSDKNKGAHVSITYNDLDLPATIAMASNDYITNVYAATGDKLQMTVTQNSSVVATYKYIGGIVYLNDVPQFIPTPEGRILSPQVSQTGAWEYEYFYLDHLGDLRVAFRSGGATRSFTATLDPPTDVAWSNVAVPVRNNEQAFNPGGFSAKLEPAHPLGPWKTIKVGKGDVVTVSAVAKYISTTQPNNSAVNLITYVNGLPAQSPESGNNQAWLSLGLQITPQAANSSQNSVPKAYLEYVLQTEADQAVTQRKRVYVTAVALNGWETLTMSYTSETDGYLQVLVANDSDQPVWFDNVSIQVQPAPITQETHYDPWGLELAGIERRGSPEHRWKFQGKESITDLSLYWQDFGARYYDPQLGRWHTPDPADQFGSPYLGLGNNPINGTDPDGRWFGVDDLIAAGIGAVLNLGINIAQGNFSANPLEAIGQGLGYLGAGAVAGGLSLYGPAGWLAGGAILGSSNAALGGKGFDASIQGGIVGAFSGLVGGAVGGGVLAGFTGTINGVTSPVINGLIKGAVGGAAGGFAGSAAGTLMTGGSFAQAVDAGMSGAVSGALIGGFTGAGAAGIKAYVNNTDPFTGRSYNTQERYKVGMNLAGIEQNNERVASVTGRRFAVPDGLDRNARVLSEVKNTARQSYTAQLRDFQNFVANNRPFRYDLYVRPSTILTQPLLNQINTGNINLRYLSTSQSINVRGINLMHFEYKNYRNIKLR